MFAVFATVLASFLLNFLAQFWEPARVLSFLSVLNYYQPMNVVSVGRLPLGDVVPLYGVGIAGWLIGGEIIARRSICTV